jgi:hypothetical protein
MATATRASLYNNVENSDTPELNWHELIPQIFSGDPRFTKTGRRRWLLKLDGRWVGIVVAWKPAGFDNFGLNQQDLNALVERTRDGTLFAGVVVLATFDSHPVYVEHVTADMVLRYLEDMPPRDGPHGPFGLLQQNFAALAEASKIF